MGLIHNRTQCMVHGQVEYALTFHVPLLVGRMIEEPLVVLRSFSKLDELLHALDPHTLDVIRSAHAADDVDIVRIVFTIHDDPASATITLSTTELTGSVQSVIDTGDVTESVQSFQASLITQLQHTLDFAKTWGGQA